MTDFEIIFDNGGGANLQTDTDVFCFTSMADLAGCAIALIAGESTDGWEGNTPDNRITNDEYARHDTSGGYKRLNADDCRQISDLAETGWRNMIDFRAAMLEEMRGVETMNASDYEITTGHVGSFGINWDTATDETLADAIEAAVEFLDYSRDTVVTALTRGESVKTGKSPNHHYDHGFGMVRRRAL
jgi:hypothetical protein